MKINSELLESFSESLIICDEIHNVYNSLEKNKILSINDLSFKKPNKYLRADKYKLLLGKKLKSNIKKDSPINIKNVK